jgi:hypothetical protein
MPRLIRRRLLTLLAAASALLALGTSPAATSLDLQNVSLGCNDGTNLALALDVAGLAELSNAVTAINVNPAGDPALACGLSQSAVTSPTVSSSDGRAHDFAVGGGRLLLPPPFTACPENFAVSAHVPTGTPTTPPQPGIGGTYNQSLPAGCGGPGGHLVAKVDCLKVVPSPSGGGTATLTAEVTRSTFAGINPGDEISSTLTDSGSNSGDTLGDILTTGPCQFKPATTTVLVIQGNINIKSGG